MPHPTRKPLERPASAQTFALELRNFLMDNGVEMPFGLLQGMREMITERDTAISQSSRGGIGGTI